MRNGIFTTLLVALFAISASAQGEWSHTNLSSNCLWMGTASIGSKVYFAGGGRGINLLPSKLIEIYDQNSGQWSSDNLSVARELPVGISTDNKIFFAGGIDLITGISYSDVDIFDVLANKWTTSQLSKSRFSIAAVSHGNEVLFAGGIDLEYRMTYATVDIYNTLTGIWTTSALSQHRGAMGFAVAGSKAVFAGGYNLNTVTDRVDIYDFNTRTWSIASLSLARGFAAATAVGNKIIIGGGVTSSNTPTDRVDIYDVSTGVWSTSKLSSPRAFFSFAASSCGKVFFAGGGNFDLIDEVWTSASDVVDIYDVNRNTWTIEHLEHPVTNHSVSSNSNHIVIAGGTDLTETYSAVDIYNCVPVANKNIPNENYNIVVFPNPAVDEVNIKLMDNINKGILCIKDLTGTIIYKNIISNNNEIILNTTNFKKGVYFIQIECTDFSNTQKFILSN